MPITKVTPANIIIPKKLNSQRTYLYNEVIDLVKKHKKPATVHNEGIDVPSPNTEFLSALKTLGIKFRNLA